LLYEPDAEVVIAKAYLGLRNIGKAKSFANSVHSKAEEMHYRISKDQRC
jgi:hypothetical protein